MIAYIGGYLVLIPVVILVLAFLVMYILSVQAKSHLRKAETTQLRVNHFVNHVFEHVFSFRATASQRKLVALHNEQQAEQSTAQAQADKFFMQMQLTTTFFAQATTVLIVMLSAHYVIEGQMTSGALAACTLLAGRTMAPVSALFSFWGQLQKANSVKDKAQTMLDSEHRASKKAANTDENAATSESNSPAAGLVVDSVMLPGSKKPISLNIKPGEVLCLDESGTGRFAAVFKSINDESKLGKGATYCSNSAGEKVDAKVAVVSGKMHLFSGTVLENLTLFDPSKNERARELCQKLALHKRIIKLPQGFETQIGNQKVSGLEYGVEQQIAIARAFLANPSLIILNHADAGLDFEAQKALATFLKENNFQSTVVVTTFSEVLKSQLPSASIQKGEAHE
jgi:ATP-binding cassette subfamily B protein